MARKGRNTTLKSMSYSTFTLVQSLVPKEIVFSGDYKTAEKFLEKEAVSSGELAEIFYCLGNRFYSAKQKCAAEMAWEKSRTLSLGTSVEKNIKENFSLNIKKKYLQTVGLVIIIIICLYSLLFFFFNREPEQFDLTGDKFDSKQLSFWDEWWDKGRPISSSRLRKFSEGDLWTLLQETFNNLFESENHEHSENILEQLKRWLEFAERPRFREGATDYYSLIARGLFEAREFEEAISTLHDSKFHAKTQKEFEKIFQDLGTVYYYRGYRLQSNGLASYDINDVRNSVRSYEIALGYGDDPYLYGNLGWGYYLLGDYSSSIENSLKALSKKPGLNYARMNLGIAYLKIGDYESAFSTYSSIPQYNPKSDEYEGGLRDLMELQIEFPGLYPFTNFVIGHLFWQQGFYEEARNSFQKFIDQQFPQKIWKERALLILIKMQEK